MALNKKQKKQIDVLKQKIQKLRQQLAGAKQQMDDPGEVERIQNQILTHEESIKTIQADA